MNEYKSSGNLFFMRLFLAIELPCEIRDSCSGIISRLASSGADLRTVDPGNLHITLKFLGEVHEDVVKEISQKCSMVSHSHSPFNLEISSVGYFGSVRFPKTVWLGIGTGRQEISGLMDDLNSHLNHIRDEPRASSPHLTLARVRSVRNTSRLVETIDAIRHVKLGEFHVKEIVLKRSVLNQGGPEYSDLEVFTLGGSSS
jgi:2'-5' RNA ligase